MIKVKKKFLGFIWMILRIFIPKNTLLRTFSGEFFGNKYLLKLSLGKIFWCYLNGFLPKEYFAFNLKHNDPSRYLSRLNNLRRGKINGEYSYLLGNKIFFERHIKSVIEGIKYLHVIENIGYIEKGHLYSLNVNVITGNLSSLRAYLEKKDLILKPISGSRGVGVLLLHKKENQYFLNSRQMLWEEVHAVLSNLTKYLIQERFVQSGFSHDIYKGSLNCMRICTMKDPDTDKPFIAYALHRFGSHYSGNTDNSSLGGISAIIRPDGHLEIGRTLSNEGEIELYEVHPLSNKPIYNQQIPNWDNITKSILEMVRRMPYLNNIGWDIVLSNGELYILEGNIGPGVNIIQVHTPLSDMPLAWNFYKYHKFFPE